MMYGRCFEAGHGFMFGGIGMFLILAVILIAAVVLITRNNRAKTGSDAIEVLKIRYAKGEISEEEYLKRKNLLD